MLKAIINLLLPKNKEVKLCLDELKILENEFSHNISFALVKKRVKDQLMDTKKTIYSVYENKMSHREIVLLLISNVTGSLIGSGHYHTYRGILSPSGFALLQLFNFAVDELEKSGFHTHDEADEDRRWIIKEIETMG